MAGYDKIGARWKSVANGAGSSKNLMDSYNGCMCNNIKPDL